MDNVLIKVLFFAKSREIAGVSQTNLQIPRKILYTDLLDLICSTFQLTVIKDNIILALNEVYCENNCELSIEQGDEIAVIPPLSGG
jgi:molybdopterin converting factor subunit 1